MPRPQFSIRTLLWLALIVAIGSLGLILERWRRIHEEEARETELLLQRIQGEPGSTTLPRVVDEQRPNVQSGKAGDSDFPAPRQ
jgi:hypothetical protein